MTPAHHAGAPPACRRTGSHCEELRVTLRVARYDEGPTSGDAEATWLIGHTERLTVERLFRRGKELLAEAIVAVPCRYRQATDRGVLCLAHGLQGPQPRPKHRPAHRRLPGDRFEYVTRGRLTRGHLEPAPTPRRPLPVMAANPCATARCRTADNTIGAACCRDLQLEILCPPGACHLEALIKSRKPPYLCKVERESPDSLGVEVISACAFLEDDGVLCSLHARRRPDGSPAKPDLCFEWPTGSTVFHTACVFRPAVTP